MLLPWVVKVVSPSGVNHLLFAEASRRSVNCSGVWLGKAWANKAMPPEIMGAETDDPDLPNA